VVTRRLRPALLGHGFCGALTTFSTMQVEVLDMIDADRLALAAAYVAASAAAGVAAVRVATTLARRW
jgi:CrcB protein